MGRKVHLSCGITGCEFDVRNGSVAGVQRVDGKVDHAFEPLVRTYIPKRPALHKRATVRNIQCDNRHRRSPLCDTPAREAVLKDYRWLIRACTEDVTYIQVAVRLVQGQPDHL